SAGWVTTSNRHPGFSSLGEIFDTWKAPEGIDWLRYAHVRVEVHDASYFRAVLSGRAAPSVRIAQLQVVSGAGETILDKRRGLGEFSLEDEADGYTYFNIESSDLPSPPGDGVYSIAIELENGAQSGGWFIVNDMASGSAPRISLPDPVTTDVQPRVLF